MTRLTIKEIVWDSFNSEHIKQHNVSLDEVKIISKTFAYHKGTYLKRYLATGRSGKRVLSIVIKRISTGKYYLITARDASKGERKKLYDKEKKQNSRI